MRLFILAVLMLTAGFVAGKLTADCSGEVAKVENVMLAELVHNNEDLLKCKKLQVQTWFFALGAINHEDFMEFMAEKLNE